MTYSKRNNRKLKPNRAQRQRIANGVAAKGWTNAYAPHALSPEMLAATQETARNAAKKDLADKMASPVFSDRAGTNYRREQRGFQSRGITVRRSGPRPIDTKRADRLAKTLNRHSK